jgi:hypothetical protein
MLDKTLADSGQDRHPTCAPADPNEAMGTALLSDLTDVIRWTDNNSARSMQTTIGPSELGSACDRKIAYRLAGTPEVNWWSDPLPAIVGTAVHTWLEHAVTEFQSKHFMDRWVTEITVQPDAMVKGHCDLYDKDLACVIDWKTVSPTKLKAWKSAGPPDHYKAQVNLYGMGLIKAGFEVRKVCLVAVPRSGWLRDDLSFEEISSAPSGECAFCPWYRGGSGKAGMSGCSGNTEASKAKHGKGLVKGA